MNDKNTRLHSSDGQYDCAEPMEGANHVDGFVMERRCDVAIVGGSAAGLAAALQLGRQQRSTIVIDASEPRNAPASHMHSYLGHEGAAPSDFATVGRAEVRSYGTEILDGRVVGVSRTQAGSFRLTLAGGHVIIARRVLAATGLVDELPDINGLSEHWGTDVLHCPFCHGYEVRDRQIVQIITHPIGLHPAKLFNRLTDQLTLVLHEGVSVATPGVDELRRSGVTVIDTPVQRVVSSETGRLAAIELTDGQRIAADAVVVTTRFAIRTGPFESLELTLAPHPTGLGDVVHVDAAGQTSIVGLYAAGNVVDPVQQVLQAAADGARVAGAIAIDLASADLSAEERFATNQADWEQRYSADQVWSGNPNGTLVAEIESMPPRTALDVGAGEGGDAVWLAERGWQVTAVDVSRNAVARIERAATERSIHLRATQADVNSRDPFGGRTFDLVTAFYASIPRTADDRGIANLTAAVAPGGILLVVDHDLAEFQAHEDTNASRAFDAAAYVSIADIVEVLNASGQWHIDTLETRPRPAGAATDHHHMQDVVLRARRHDSR